MIENLYSLAFEIVLFALTAIGVHLIVELRLRKVSGETVSELGPALFKGVLILGCTLVLIEVGQSVLPLSNALKRTAEPDVYTSELLTSLGIFYAVGLLLMVINYWLAVLLFTVVSRGQKVFSEVKVGNWAAPVVFGALYIGLSLLSRAEITPVLDYLIPYPEIPMFG